MRRLPIYFLIDVSESMVGEPIEQVEQGLRIIVQELKTDPYALETAYISVIVFAGKARTIMPLCDVITFYPPQLPIGGGTSLGNALNHLMVDLDKNVIKTTAESKGDWKPIVFLFTDGNPTDSVENAFREWENKYKRSTHMVAISIGDNADTTLLKRLTDEVHVFKNTDKESYKRFFKWITASIKAQSTKVNMGGSVEFELAKPDSGTVSKVDREEAPAKVDENFAVLVGKCQKTRNGYLIKYKRVMEEAKQLYGLSYNTVAYGLVGAYKVSNSYYELSDSGGTNKTINTSELLGAPHCPNCGNQFGFSLCSCGGIFCVGGAGTNTCPWCEKQAHFDYGEGDTNVNRTKG